MVSRELLGPANLSRAQILRIHETTEVIMVRKDKNLMLETFQIVMLRLEGFDNGQKLAVVSLIPNLCRNYFSKKEGYWVPLA